MSAIAADSTQARVVQHWPAALGLAAAAISLVIGVSVAAEAITVAVAGVCYLGAAALDRRWVAWAAIPAGSVVVVASELVGLPWWVGLGITAVALIVAGGLLRVPRVRLTAQTAAGFGFAGVAVAGLSIDPRVGLALAGVALASHAMWDVIHYRRDVVVPRSLSEACMFLDLPLGIGAVVLAFYS